MPEEAVQGSLEEAVVATEATEAEESATETEKEVPEEKKEEQKERSRFGRRLSKMEQTLFDFMERTGQVLENFQRQPMEEKVTKQTLNELQDDDIVTVRDLKRLWSEEQNKTMTAQKEYESGYVRHLKTIGGDEDPDLNEEIVKEMMTNFNIRHSNDPQADAERNYYRAARVVLKKATPDKKNPLKGEKPKGATGVGGDTALKDRDLPIPELDEYAKEFVQKVGMKEDSIKKALKGETPLSLRKI